MSRAERARAAAEQERLRVEALERKGEQSAGDVVAITHASTPSASTTAEPTPSSNGVSADRPIAKKTERQGIDLRPEDRDRVTRFEIFCLQNRVKVGKKRGLTLYARVGFQLLEDLIATDRARAEELLRSFGEKKA